MNILQEIKGTLEAKNYKVFHVSSHIRLTDEGNVSWVAVEYFDYTPGINHSFTIAETTAEEVLHKVKILKVGAKP